MIQRNSVTPDVKFDLYNQINNEEMNVNSEEDISKEDNEKYQYEVNTVAVKNTQDSVEKSNMEKRKKISFFSHQLMIGITIAIIFFVINTFTPQLYYELINFFKEEISMEINFKEDAKNVISIIKSTIDE